MPKSKWWSCFSRIDNQTAKCRMCGRYVKTSGNTSNLKAHIVKVHPKSIEAVPELTPLIGKVKKIVSWFKSSVRASDELRASNSLKLIQSVETRWNSTYYMIERFLSLSSTLNTIVHKHTSAPMMTTASENRDLQDVVTLLEPLLAATKQLEGENYPTISMAIPVAYIIENKIGKISPSCKVGYKLKEVILEPVRKRLTVENNPVLAISTLLDPRWKKLYFRDPSVLEQTIKELKEILTSSLSPKSAQSSDSDHCEERSSSSFFNEHAKIVEEAWKLRSSRVCDEGAESN
nr:zinc finger BED domain-containing protein 1-like [Halyomorpha halys]